MCAADQFDTKGQKVKCQEFKSARVKFMGGGGRGGVLGTCGNRADPATSSGWWVATQVP